MLFLGMLKSVTNFASSVSRNMDRLSFDGNHIKRQEESRRHRPDGVGDGLKQGLTGLGINLLGIDQGLILSSDKLCCFYGAPRPTMVEA